VLHYALVAGYLMPGRVGDQPVSSGAKPRRIVFSVTVRGSMN
jgi:hypothetical protein